MLMPKKTSPTKASKKVDKPRKKTTWLSKHNGVKFLIAFGVIVLLLITGNLYDKKSERDFIKGLDRDMLSLKQSLETGLGQAVEYETDCFRTAPKGGGGQVECTLKIENHNEPNRDTVIKSINSSENFKKGMPFSNGLDGFNYSYQHRDPDCYVLFVGEDNTGFYFSCTVGAKDSNEQFVKNFLNNR